MEIKQEKTSKGGYFKAEENGTQAGMVTYVSTGQQMIIVDHTEVNAKFKGQGVGKDMILKVVDYARENNLKILPLCPFAKNFFSKTPEIADVLA